MSDWLIWSNEHAMWWGPDEHGYTAVIEGAGVYPEAEAKRIVADASLDGQLVVDRVDSLGQRRRVPPEVAVPSPWASRAAEEAGDVSEYRVTFGQRFRHDGHKMFGAAHPDGWVTVLARDYQHARAITVAAFGTEWSGLYEAHEIGTDLFPLGELLRLDGTEEPLT